jgi:hypothetical protein
MKLNDIRELGDNETSHKDLEKAARSPRVVKPFVEGVTEH